jgi:phage host-nuclease inhibitor protein Gam
MNMRCRANRLEYKLVIKINGGKVKDPVNNVTPLQTFDDVDSRLKQIAEHETFLAQEEANMNEEINDLRAKYDERTKAARAQKTVLEQEVEGYCKANKNRFDSQRSMNLTFGVVSFRTAPPKVSQLNKKYSIATSIELLKKLFKGGYVRTKEEIDKEGILASYASKEITDEKLAAVGLRIDQEEKFNYQINWEKIKEVK